MIAGFQELLHKVGQLFVWIVIVAPWEQALRIRLGNRVRLLEAGWYLVIPFVDRVYRQSIRRRLGIVAPQTLTTRDGFTITVGSAIGYNVADLKQLYNSLHDADDTIDSEVASLVSSYVASNDAAFCTPEKIEEFVRDKLKLSEYGLGSQEFYVTNYAKAKTMRFITGEIRGWRHGQGLNTNQFDGQQKT